MISSAATDTLTYYDNHAAATAQRYEQVDSRLFLEGLPIWVQNKAKILDLGSGSGRDAAFLLSEEYDVYGIDGSKAMVEESIRLHPELSERLTHQILPGPLPYRDESFDAVISIAFLMHLNRSDVQELCREVLRVLSPHGVFWFSIRLPAGDESTGQPGAEDHCSEVFDESDRFFLRQSVTLWRELIEAQGFYCKKCYLDEDALGRSCQWGRFAFVKDER
ncbi:MAG: class I SAM-dependent methyltransferase [Spirochaetia bacterium]|nr:class I SAM-dependent methyltransferase [Spirochaetia bacterium]MCF7941134.1 class I SAM-dependent methyltransferase [Spirochaetia bacterium]